MKIDGKFIGIEDTSGALSEAMTEKYFSYCIEAGTMGNWTEMIPGMIDVSIYKSILLCSSNSTFYNPFY